MSKYICEKGKEQYKMCKKYDADYCSDCPHSRKYDETMSKEEAIQKLRETQDSYLKDELDIAIGVVLQLIDKLEKALIEEQLKHTEKINDAIKWLETLQSGGTSCNCGDLQLVLDILEE